MNHSCSLISHSCGVSDPVGDGVISHSCKVKGAVGRGVISHSSRVRGGVSGCEISYSCTSTRWSKWWCNKAQL